MELSFIQIILLTLWGFVAINELLFTYIGFWQRPIVAGTVAGIIVGDINVGIIIGSTLEMISLGVHSYGGAVVPDYTTGAILGTVFGYLTGSTDTGIAIGVPIALLGAYLDVAARLSTSICAHKGDYYAARGDLKHMWIWHISGCIPWGLSRALPVFVGAYFGADLARMFIDMVPVWLTDGFAAAGHAMPAMGVALLLNYLPVNKQWPFVILGFVLAAFIGLPMIAVGLLGLVSAIVYTTLFYKGNNESDNFEEIGGEF